MTTVRETPGSATARMPHVHSRNGGPPKAGGPSPALVIAIAFVVGVTVARVLSWRAHAHPR